MRIRRENKGNDIVVTMSCDIESPDLNLNDEVQIDSLMKNYGIPISIEMMTQAMKVLMKEFQRTKNMTDAYTFTLTCSKISEENNVVPWKK